MRHQSVRTQCTSCFILLFTSHHVTSCYVRNDHVIAQQRSTYVPRSFVFHSRQAFYEDGNIKLCIAVIQNSNKVIRGPQTINCSSKLFYM